MDLSNLRPFPTPPSEVARLQEFVPGSRTDMFRRVMAAVACASGEAESLGDASYVRQCDELFGFLEGEREKAAAEEGLTSLLRWEESIFER